MRILYLDCAAGIAGDMLAAALIDLLPEDDRADLRAAVDRLGLEGAGIEIRRVTRRGFAALDVVTTDQPDPPARHLPDVLGILRGAGLEPDALAVATEMFERLAAAEARVHGVEPERVHFHEVGAVDSILDVLAVSWALHRVAADRVVCSPLPLGRGHVDCAHGRIPVPAPATLALLEGVPVLGGDIDGETVTPTGAAAAVVLADAFGPLPPGRLLGTGIGAGKAERDAPNLLRALLLEADGTSTEVVQIETNVDDMPAEAFAPLMDRLFEAGALDVALCPVQMKKNRPGVLVTVIADPERSAGITEALLLHSTTFGVRESRMRRTCLERDEVRVETPWGPVRAKRGRLSGRTVRVVPEHDDCRRLAGEKGVPYMDVYRAALAAGDQSKSTSSG